MSDQRKLETTRPRPRNTCVAQGFGRVYIPFFPDAISGAFSSNAEQTKWSFA